MIRLGFDRVSIWPNSGIMLELRGDIVFSGHCDIGNASYITTGSGSHLSFGDNFGATSSLRLVCYDRIEFGNDVLVGWDCMFMDSDFHKLTRDDSHPVRSFAPILIGGNNWFGNGCLIMKGTRTSFKTTIAARTVLTKDYTSLPEKCIIGESRNVEVLRDGIWRNIEDDGIDYGVRG